MAAASLSSSTPITSPSGRLAGAIARTQRALDQCSRARRGCARRRAPSADRWPTTCRRPAPSSAAAAWRIARSSRRDPGPAQIGLGGDAASAKLLPLKAAAEPASSGPDRDGRGGRSEHARSRSAASPVDGRSASGCRSAAERQRAGRRGAPPASRGRCRASSAPASACARGRRWSAP